MLKPGQELVCIGSIGTFGVKKLLQHRGAELHRRFGSRYLAEETEKLEKLEGKKFPELRLTELSAEYGISKLRPVGEGGILWALWKFCDEEGIGQDGKRRNSGVGCEFRYDRIPVGQFTLELCELFDLLPYRLFSQHCFLAAADRGYQLAERIRREGGEASVFGIVTEGKGRIRTDGAQPAFLTKDPSEALYRVLELNTVFQ